MIDRRKRNILITIIVLLGIASDQISKVWLEILKDDQHIKSLIKDIETSKDEIKNEEDERRFIDLIENKH